MIDNTKLSKTVSLILRHDPASYGIELDRDGWVSVSSLMSVLKGKELCWRGLTASHLEEMVRRSEKRRHEIQDGRIRALYGHSTPDKLFREATRPPDFLYHGTVLRWWRPYYPKGSDPWLDNMYTCRRITIPLSRWGAARQLIRSSS